MAPMGSRGRRVYLLGCGRTPKVDGPGILFSMGTSTVWKPLFIPSMIYTWLLNTYTYT